MSKISLVCRSCTGISLLMTAFVATSCTPPSDLSASLVNLEHLDYLGEEIVHEGDTLRIVHIYADAPSYQWIGDDDEGSACVDDAARAAVVYLQDFELTGNNESARKAKQLLRFTMYMQNEEGLFYNFVWNSDLDINVDHENSRADEFGWWAARATWALGTGAEVLQETDPEFSQELAESIQRILPHLDQLLEQYGSFYEAHSRIFPTWLINRSSSNATSELLLGLIAFNRYREQPALQRMIGQFAEGIATMQYGSVTQHPYLAHAADDERWNGWGNSQTQALSQTGFLETAEREASAFYPRLLIDGWKYSFSLSDSTQTTEFPQIAYAVRVVTVGLLRLYDRTNDVKYAKMAGLAASWFTGNNVVQTVMYEPKTGRGYDGINSSSIVNRNSGAESTVEALMTIQDVEQVPEAKKWMFATSSAPVRTTVNDAEFYYRVFTANEKIESYRIAVVLDLTSQRFMLLEQDVLKDFLADSL